MKRSRVWLILILLTSCQLPEYQLPEIDVTSIEDINLWVHENVEYKADVEPTTQSPADTLFLLTGDCRAQATLVRFLSMELLGLETKIVSYWVGGWGHSVVEYDGVWHDPTSGTSEPAGESWF